MRTARKRIAETVGVRACVISAPEIKIHTTGNGLDVIDSLYMLFRDYYLTNLLAILPSIIILSLLL